MEDLRFSDYCANCRKSLENIENILFVEKEVGRCFCAEECIREYFQPTIDFMREELVKLRSDADINDDDASRYAHYQALTLEDPDEVWIDETETGERHFTFIAHYRNGDDRMTYVVVTLAIEATPSFVFLGFATRNEDLVDEYRRGVDLRIGEPAQEAAEPQPTMEPSQASATTEQQPKAENPSERLHESEPERLYGEMRQPGDIAREDFGKYEQFIEASIDEPDEIWRFVDDLGNEWLSFIARFTGEQLAEDADDFSIVVVCEPGYDPEKQTKTLDLVFAFPTIDPGLVQHFRKGVNSLNKAFGVGWTRGHAA